MAADQFPLWTVEKLLRLSRERLGLRPDEAVQVEPIVKGGSVRTFHRLTWGGGRTAILMHYSQSKPENGMYAGLTAFLRERNVRVPGILAGDAPRQLLWIEDIGRADLLSLVQTAPQSARLAAYTTVLEELARLQTIRLEDLPAAQVPSMMAGFDAATYLWEQDYFLEHCLGGYFRLPAERLRELRALPALEQLAVSLGSRQPVLVHRDFQSTNIIMRNAQTAYFIDFQGMRPGRAGYDVASLIFDPYVNLSKGERDLLLAAYLELRPAYLPALSRRDYLGCVMQRLMQALGAYGNLGLNVGHNRFLEYIPVALPLLLETLEELGNPGLRPLESVLRECAETLAPGAPASGEATGAFSQSAVPAAPMAHFSGIVAA